MVITKMLQVCATGAAEKINLQSVSNLKVVARCDCGCDTVDFEGVDWATPPAVVADGQGKTEANDHVGIIVFANDSTIVRLEVYNHGYELARLPTLESIVGYGPAI
jgi:hypothetical protein